MFICQLLMVDYNSLGELFVCKKRLCDIQYMRSLWKFNDVSKSTENPQINKKLIGIFLGFGMLGMYEYANCRLNAWLHHFSWSFYKKAILLLRLLFRFKKILDSSLTLYYSVAITFYLWRVAWFLKIKYMKLMQNEWNSHINQLCIYK